MTRAKALSRELLPALPLAAFFLVFFVTPLVLLVVMSFFTGTQLDHMGLRQYTKFFGDAFNVGILLDTLWLGLQATLLCAALVYPLALYYVRATPFVRTLLIFAIVLPLLTSAVVRTFAWIVILGREGIINNALVDLGMASAPLQLLYTKAGVVVALTQFQLPLMALPVINSLLRIDPNLSQASLGLSAGHWRTFWLVLFPLSLPGLIAGALLVFAASVTAFITQSLVGGGRLIYMPIYIYQQAVVLQDWPFAAAISVLFTVAVLGIVASVNQLAGKHMGAIRVA